MRKFTLTAYSLWVFVIMVGFAHPVWAQPITPAALSGTYLGNIPCADCEKIVVTLQLKDDSTYSATMVYAGKSEQPLTEQGSFRLTEQGLVELDAQRDGMKLFRKQPEGLLMLDTHGNLITGALAEKYMLFRQKDSYDPLSRESSMNFMADKWQQGIDFYAVGNEPAWSLDLDFAKVFKFKTIDGQEFNAPAVPGDMAQDAPVTRYRTLSESGEMIITIYGQDCSDQMSDQTYHCQVRVELKRYPADDFITYIGCGNYVPDMRIHDVWAVSALGTTKLDAAEFAKGIPRLEINIKENRVSGHDGCNSFTGSAKVKGQNITFGNLASTRMACLNMQTSTRLAQLLSGKAYSFTIADNQLLLKTGNQVVMTLQHGD